LFGSGNDLDRTNGRQPFLHSTSGRAIQPEQARLLDERLSVLAQPI
jgi:hypothetical protein